MDLRDLRAKISVETDAALDAMSRSSGQDRSEIVRKILHEWALHRIDEATLLLRRLEAEGFPAPHSGARGNTHP